MSTPRPTPGRLVGEIVRVRTHGGLHLPDKQASEQVYVRVLAVGDAFPMISGGGAITPPPPCAVGDLIMFKQSIGVDHAGKHYVVVDFDAVLVVVDERDVTS